MVSTRRKQFLLTAIGTRGDAQPLVAIAKRLMRDGHTVRVAVHRSHRESAEKQGVLWWELEGFEPEILMQKEMGNCPGFDVIIRGIRLYIEWYKSVNESTLAAATAPLADGTPFCPDCIVASHQQFAVLSVAEKVGASLFYFNTYPMTPTSEFRHPFGLVLEGKDSRDTPTLNLWTYSWFDIMTQFGVGATMKEFRAKLGLPVTEHGWHAPTQVLLTQLRIPCLCIWSPNILPKPHDWHEDLVVCGSVDRTGGLPDLPADLVKFCMADEQPIFFGFGPGSMSNETTIARSWAAAVATIEQLKCRAVLHITPNLRKYIPRVPPNTFVLDIGVPHAKLFELCSIIVHHGGPGTLHAALRAGKPNCIVSYVCDNPFWGDRLSKLGVGSHVPSRAVTAPLLVEAVRKLMEPEVTKAAVLLGKRMATEEDGVDVLARELYKRTSTMKVDYTSLHKRCPRSYALSLWPMPHPLPPTITFPPVLHTTLVRICALVCAGIAVYAALVGRATS